MVILHGIITVGYSNGILRWHIAEGLLQWDIAMACVLFEPLSSWLVFQTDHVTFASYVLHVHRQSVACDTENSVMWLNHCFGCLQFCLEMFVSFELVRRVCGVVRASDLNYVFLRSIAHSHVFRFGEPICRGWRGMGSHKHCLPGGSPAVGITPTVALPHQEAGWTWRFSSIRQTGSGDRLQNQLFVTRDSSLPV